MLHVAMLRAATHKCATLLVFMSVRSLSCREFHQSWSCRPAGLPEISEGGSSARMAIKSTSFSSAFGTVRTVRIFAMLRFGLTAANQFTGPAKSIWAVAIGKHMVTGGVQVLE